MEDLGLSHIFSNQIRSVVSRLEKARLEIKKCCHVLSGGLSPGRAGFKSGIMPETSVDCRLQ